MNGPVVLGFGCERGIRETCVREGIRSFLEQNERGVRDLVRVATLELKNDESGLIGAVRRLPCELVFYSVEQLVEVGPPPNPSPVVKRCVGVEGVCEPAALRAGDTDQLEVEKTVLRPGQKNMTLAMAIPNPEGKGEHRRGDPARE